MPIDERFLDNYVLLCKTIAKPDRLRIINHLETERLSVGQLGEKLNLSFSNLSNHLNDMYKMGVLGKKREGKQVFYYLVNPDLVNGISALNDEIIKLFRLKSKKQAS